MTVYELGVMREVWLRYADSLKEALRQPEWPEIREMRRLPRLEQGRRIASEADADTALCIANTI